MIQREARASLESQRDQLIAALYANSNFSGEEGAEARAETIKTLEKHFNKAITLVYYPDAFKGQEIDWDNPFWQAAKRSQQRMKQLMDSMQGQAETLETSSGMGISPKQEKAREDSRRSIDQI